jgi:hypothetical protein
MKPKKTSNQPSTKERLSAAFVNDFLADYEAEGISAIRALRSKSPEKYCEIATRLIAAHEPQAEGFKACQNMHEIGFRLLQNAGVNEFDITEAMIEDAIAANDAFIARLQEIADQAPQGSRVQ